MPYNHTTSRDTFKDDYWDAAVDLQIDDSLAHSLLHAVEDQCGADARPRRIRYELAKWAERSFAENEYTAAAIKKGY